MPGMITSANAKLQITIPGVFSVPQLLQGWATDDAFSSEPVKIAEVVKGVDGRMSAGYVPALYPMRLMFQADSLSVPTVMEAWRAANSASVQTGGSIFLASAAVIIMPDLTEQWQFISGVLEEITPFPQAKKILQPVSYRIIWDSYSAAPLL